MNVILTSFFFLSFLSEGSKRLPLYKPAINSLHEAVYKGDIERVKALIKKGADINEKGEAGDTPLHWIRGDDDVAKLLIKHRADVNAQDEDGNTPLHKSIRTYSRLHCSPFTKVYCPPYDYTKKIEKAKFLIEHGANVNSRNNSGDTPLHFAPNIEIAKLLIDNGADVNVRDKSRFTPLHNAKNYKIAKLLIDNGADVNARTFYGEIPLHRVHLIEIAKLLIDNGSELNVLNRRKQTPCDTNVSKKVIDFIRQNGGKCKFSSSIKELFKHYNYKETLWDKIQNFLIWNK